MRIFITGGTGFIGTHLVKKLQDRSHELCLLAANLAETEKWQKEIRDFSPDAFIHLAWEGLPDYSSEMCMKNIKYAADLFSFIKETGCKTVLSVGSAWEKSNPDDVFPVSKRIVNALGKSMFDNFIWARIFFVYGPGQRETSLIPYLLSEWRKHAQPVIKNPAAKNDFIFIDDVAEAIAILLENGKGGEYDIGSGKLTSNQEVINMVGSELKISGWEKPISDISEEGTKPADNRKLVEIGWKPANTLHEGIIKTINFINNN